MEAAVSVQLKITPLPLCRGRTTLLMMLLCAAAAAQVYVYLKVYFKRARNRVFRLRLASSRATEHSAAFRPTPSNDLTRPPESMERSMERSDGFPSGSAPRHLLLSVCRNARGGTAAVIEQLATAG
ncbi:hypothetical protein EYF80_007246 [Liparis tanakae]|uniref:Uncharacterized protein n=1 Tax=Liparis tanakae TaxID=230148 RepID=A0A4Z2IXC5_9TELE|nr:hypothetical protein EYF80_007246 [Liparis tanakae]